MGSFMKTFHRHIWIVLSQIYHHRGRTSYVFSMTDHLGNRLDCRGIWWIRHRVTHSQALSNLCLQSKRKEEKNLTNWEILCCKNRIIDNAGRSKNVRNFGGKEILESKMYTPKPSLKIVTANTICWNSLGLFRHHGLNFCFFVFWR